MLWFHHSCCFSLHRLNATFAYWPISQDKFLLKENQQVQVSVLAQIPTLHKPRAGAMLVFTTTWHKTQTTVELLTSLHTTVVSEPQGGAVPAQPSWPPCQGCCRVPPAAGTDPAVLSSEECRFPNAAGWHTEASQHCSDPTITSTETHPNSITVFPAVPARGVLGLLSCSPIDRQRKGITWHRLTLGISHNQCCVSVLRHQ